ncbi:DNA polymerase Y family protein [Propionivibrio sp.]|uniref:Y-family DNA polymerase n=1 Tax=Propionivibrio sp. TaxID=2212460 RepID=UPI0025D1ECDA|nr:DNA polymerase Y family protein [Propionivibrio sp.]MBK8744252.1 DNA polymerase Y family protein [Propionivibrio sp.]
MNSRVKPLWLALHLPCLPLEANLPLSSPSAVVEQGRVLLGDQAARRAGVESGMGIAASRMLAPAIALIARDRPRETSALQTLACWAGNLTPRVSLVPDTLLLEVGSCLRLFGGLEAVVSLAREGVQAQHYSVEVAAAPTPLGAQWLAQARTQALCSDQTTLRQQLETLPVEVLPHKAAEALRRFGITTLAAVVRLPSAALARRIGREVVRLIAQALGDQPDPRPDFVFPERFALSLELPATVEYATALLFAARRLIFALAGWLSARQAGVREIVLQLQHRHTVTDVVLRFADLTADGSRFERVLRERLERFTLQAPVESLLLTATQVVPRPHRNQALFEAAQDTADAIGNLLERLSARLGEKQVYAIATHDDHRPECATQAASLFGKVNSGITPGIPPVLPRPLWLLEKPELLSYIQGRPCRCGPLTLLAGPERIEAGWWDTRASRTDVRRDYFIARSADARWLWIYRECQAPGRWFLQGFFA